MSCLIMNPEPLAAIANAAETLLNCGYEYFGFDPSARMHDAFRDCRTGGSYDAEGIYKKLWAVNAAAYNGRYALMDDELADETAPVIYVFCYKVHQRPEYAEHHHAVRPWHYHLAKLLDFWLYQTAEDATRDDPIRAAMLDFQRSLFAFIVQRSDEYDNAPPWGRLRHNEDVMKKEDQT